MVPHKVEHMQVIVMVSLLIRVEKYERQDYDEKLPLTYGLVGQETCVPGSIAYGLRFITGIIELIDYMQQYPARVFCTMTRPLRSSAFVRAKAPAGRRSKKSFLASI